jgi:hypothetical protein
MPDLHTGGSPWNYLVPIAVVVLIVIRRGSRPRPLKIERLWIYPVILLLVMASSLAAAPPPVTPVSIGLLVLGFVLGIGLGWQRGRFTQIHIHPETHELSSQSSFVGMIFILAIFALRYGARYLLAGNADYLLSGGDALLVLAVAMMATQRLELWLRARRMLEEAKTGGPTITPPLVR